MMNYLSLICVIGLSVTTAFGAAVPIQYQLPRAARVSILITDAGGNVVRELLHAAPRPAGANAETWDGLNDQAQPVPAGDYRWKLLSTQGLHAEYLLTLGTNPTPAWDTWPGNHGGLWSVASDAEGFYFGGGSGEGTPLLVKQSFDGKRLWQIRDWLVAWAGVTDMAVDRQVVYLLTVSLFRFDATKGTQIGTPWTSDVIKSAVQIAARGGQIVIVCPDAPQLRWLDPNDGHIVDQATLAGAFDVAIDAAGHVLAVAGGQLVSLTRADKSPKVVIPAKALVSPVRIAIDLKSDELYVAENPYPKFDNSTPATWGNKDGQHVKRFSRAGKLLKAYGKVGGRLRYGPYDPTGFAGIYDLAVDGQGGFLVTEPAVAPRRVAHFNAKGKLVREWYGGQQYANHAEVDPADPSLVWLDTHWGELIQAKVDYRRKTWRVRATYRFADLADGLIGGTYHGGGRWHVRHHAGQTYLLREGPPCVVRVDERQHRLVPVVMSALNIRHYWDTMPATLKRLVGTDDKTRTDKNSYLWMDRNGDGKPQADEMNFSTWTDWWGGLAPAADFNYYAWDGKIVAKLPVTGWTNGVPLYPQWGKPEVVAHFPPVEVADNRGPTQLYRDLNGALYGAFNTDTKKAFGATFWAKTVGGNRLLKWDAAGKFQWAVGRHAATDHAAAGEAFFFWRMIGGVHGCVAVGDVDNSLVHVWDEDGLWVGRLLENPDLKAAPATAYSLCGENFAGSLYENPRTGEVLFFGGGQNNTPVYRITGWDQFQRQHGDITLP